MTKVPIDATLNDINNNNIINPKYRNSTIFSFEQNDDLKTYKNHLENEIESIKSFFITIFKLTRTYRCLKRKFKILNDLKNVYFTNIKTPFNYIILNLLTILLIWFLIHILTYDDVKAAVKAQNLKFSITCEHHNQPQNQTSSYNFHQKYLNFKSEHYNFKSNDSSSCSCKLFGHCLAREPPDNFKIYTKDLEFSQYKEFYMHPVQTGGYWRPPECIPDYTSGQNHGIDKVTFIIIPYLNRYDNLKELLYNLHPFLQRQLINYRIVVVEQLDTKQSFNKGRLYNAAFSLLKDVYSNRTNSWKEMLNVHDGRLVEFSCMILHDVDLLPENDYNIYECDDYTPRHLSLSIRRNENLGYYRNLYELLVGGVLTLKPNMYEKINGFSNEYWKWGAEDDGEKII
jgi:hypothetical protein